MKKNMIKLFSTVTKNERNVWNNMFSNFLKGDKNEKMRLLGSVMDVYGFSSMEKEQNQATYAIADFMKSLNIKEYCYLENVYRCWNYEWEAEKRKSNYWTYDNMFSCIMGIRDEERKRAVLIPGCMSSDGHLRQKCLKELANYKNSLPFLLLRLNDWVKEIRVDAFEFSVQRMQRADVEELLLALPVIEKIRNSNRKNNEDFAVIYIAQLDHEKFKIVIDGLGETADKETVDQLLPFLEDSDWKVIRKALRAIGSLLKEEGEEYYLRFLHSENIALVKEAYRQCRKWEVMMDIKTLMDMYENCKVEQQKCYYLLLLRKCPYWDRITIYLRLYGRVSEKQQDIISRAVRFRPMYQQLTEKKGNKIRNELEMNRDYLPEWLIKGVLFDIKHLTR